MLFFGFLNDYLRWHYSEALTSYLRVFRNFWWFIVQFFSIKELPASLLAPFKRMTEPRARGFNLEEFLTRLIINTLSRLLGLIIRLTVLTTGLVGLTLYTILSVCFYIVWLAAPALIVFCLVYGLWLMF